MSRLQEALAAGKFVVTAEVAPPKGTNPASTLAELEPLKGIATAVNVTDMQGAHLRASALATAQLVLLNGVEPILQMTTRDRNRLALQGDLLGAAMLGVENVLCLRGDPPGAGDHPDARGVFDLDTLELIRVARLLASGRDMAGGALDGPPRLFVGAAVSPELDPLEKQIDGMKAKVDAGAQFFQTQITCDVARFAEFADRARGLGVPVLAGVVVLKSAQMARFMNEHIPGVRIDQASIDALEKAGKGHETGVRIAARTIRALRPVAQGVHLYPMGWARHVPEILREAGLQPG